MGSVYLALDRGAGRTRVAVKEMVLERLRGDDREHALAQFRHEAMLLASLEHPQLVQVFDFFEGQGRAWLVMACVDGTTLAREMHTRPVTVLEVLDWVDQICDVLEYLHGLNPPVLFRDMKPGNVMLDDQNLIRLIDFGIARTFDRAQATRTFLRGSGTLEFAPIEQFGATGTDPRSDIYGLGATMYTLLTGSPPPSSIEVLAEETALPSPAKLNPALPPRLCSLVMKAMALRKDDRYQTVQEMRRGLLEAARTVSPRALARRPEPEHGSTPSLSGNEARPPGTQFTGGAVSDLASSDAPSSPQRHSGERLGVRWGRHEPGALVCATPRPTPLLATDLGEGRATGAPEPSPDARSREYPCAPGETDACSDVCTAGEASETRSRNRSARQATSAPRASRRTSRRWRIRWGRLVGALLLLCLLGTAMIAVVRVLGGMSVATAGADVVRVHVTRGLRTSLPGWSHEGAAR